MSKADRRITNYILHEKTLAVVAIILSIPALWYGCRADRLASRIAQTHLKPSLVAKWAPVTAQESRIALVNQGPVEIKSLKADLAVYFFRDGVTASLVSSNIYRAFARHNLTDAALLKATLGVEEKAEVDVPVTLFPGAEDALVRMQTTYYRGGDMEEFSQTFDFLVVKGSVTGPKTTERVLHRPVHIFTQSSRPIATRARPTYSRNANGLKRPPL